jgi:hypothetical protein
MGITMRFRFLVAALMLVEVLTSSAIAGDVGFPLSFDFAQSQAVSRGDSIELEFVATATNVSDRDFVFSGGFWFNAWYHPAESEMGGRERGWGVWGYIDDDWIGVTPLEGEQVTLVPGASLSDTFAFSADAFRMSAWPGTLVVSSVFIYGPQGTPRKDAMHPPQGRQRIAVQRPSAVRPPN